MKKVTLFAAAGLIALLNMSVFAAGDMVLTLDDGRDVILHEDNTWGFAKFTLSEGNEEDIYITLSDNRTICLKNDNTWSFTKGQPPRKKSAKELPEIIATGSATRGTLDVAVNAATEDGIKRVATRLTPYCTKSKKAGIYLAACIKNEIGESGAEVKYTPGWNATAKITLNKAQAKKVVECVEDQIALQTPTPEDTVKTKSGAKSKAKAEPAAAGSKDTVKN